MPAPFPGKLLWWFFLFSVSVHDTVCGCIPFSRARSRSARTCFAGGMSMFAGKCVEVAEGVGTGKRFLGLFAGLLLLFRRDVRALAACFPLRKHVEFTVGPKEIVTLAGHRRVRLTCLQGRIWATAKDDWHDYELRSGDAAVLGGAGLIAVMGCAPSSRIAISR